MNDSIKSEKPSKTDRGEVKLPTINDSKDFIYVNVNQFGCTRSDNDNPLIKTKALGPCIGLVIRDPESTTTTVAHIAGLTGRMHPNNEMMRDVVECLYGMKRSGLEIDLKDRKRLSVSVIGGYDDNDGRLSALTNALEQLNLPKPNLDLRSKPDETLSFAVDSRTGDISFLTNFVQDQKLEDLDMDMMQSRFKSENGIRITSDPRSLGR
jgi:hypothetical protein